jgi:thiol-disulfide isomerase/thioredoxin
MTPRLLLVIALAGCQNGSSAPPGRGKLELIEAPPTTDIATYLAPLVARASGDQKTLVVYVGASWCEPCRHFHDAAAASQLDDRFGDLRIIAFDADRDAPALDTAGYRSSMLPLFALPNADGRASGKQFAGSIKGDGAVAQIAPNLRALVDRH